MEAENSMEKFLKDVEANLETFSSKTQFPLTTSRVQSLVSSDQEAYELYQSCRPIVHQDVLALMTGFLEVKRKYGSKVEKKLYGSMQTTEEFLTRLLRKRAVCFVGRMDGYVLRDGTAHFGQWETVGTDEERHPLVLDSYLSYDEIKISALIGLSSSTKFINDGARNNKGIPMAPGTFEDSGIIVGLVGPRFARPGVMEYHDMVIDVNMSTPKNGFGADEKRSLKSKATEQSVQLNRLWAKFYKVDNLPTHDEAKTLQKNVITVPDKSNRFFNVQIYKRRIEILAETLLLEADSRAEAGKLAHVYVVGFGLGVWCLAPLQKEQNQFFLDAFGSVLERLQLNNVAVVEFGWIPGDISQIKPLNDNLTIISTKSNPQRKLDDSTKLLVISYAWDGNAYPGNEYWEGNLNGSGDSAAASCSLIGEIQNPAINTQMVCGSNAKIL